MSYYKIFVLSAISSVLFLSVFVIVAFDSENALKEAFEHYAKENYSASRTFLLNEDITIPLADFYLYESYLARDELGIKKSQNYLLQALNESKIKKTTSALEIYLNLSLNAFILKEPQNLKLFIEEAKLITSADESYWIDFFNGCYCYLLKDYHKAYLFWKDSKDKKWLSNWMKTSFCRNSEFNNIEYMFLHSMIASNHLFESKDVLKNLMIKTSNDDICKTLSALCYFQDAVENPSMSSLLYKNGIFELNDTSRENFLWKQEKNTVFTLISNHILSKLKSAESDDIHFFVSFLETNQAYTEIEILAKNISQEIFDHMSDDKITNLVKSLPNGHLKQVSLSEITKNICILIDNKQLKKTRSLIASIDDLTQDINTKQLILNALESSVFSCLDISTETCREAFDLWKKIENTPYKQYLFAKHLIKKCYQLWSLNNKNFFHSIAMVKEAAQFSQIEYEEDLKFLVNNSVKKIYNQFNYSDDIEGLTQVLAAAEHLDLNLESIISIDDAYHQIADAYYYLKTNHLNKALLKTNFALKLAPNCKDAHKLACLIHYKNNDLLELAKHVHDLDEADESLTEIWAVYYTLSGNNQKAEAFLKNVFDADDLKLKLAVHFLSFSQPDAALFWLEQVESKSQDVIITKMIASFQKNNFKDVIYFYSLLNEREKNIPAIAAILIQTYVCNHELEKADDLFVKFALSIEPYAHFNEISASHSSLTKLLANFNPYGFAGRYYLHIKNDSESANKMFSVYSSKQNLSAAANQKSL